MGVYNEYVAIVGQCTKIDPRCATGKQLQADFERAQTIASKKEWNWGTENAKIELSQAFKARQLWYAHVEQCQNNH